MNPLDGMANTAYVWQARGEDKFGKKLLINGLAFYKKVLGEKDPNTIGTTMRSLSMIWRKQGRYEQAERLLGQALALLKEVLEDKHPYAIKMTRQLEDWRSEGVTRQPSRGVLHDAFKTPPILGAWPEEPEEGMEEEYVAICGEVDQGGGARACEDPTAGRTFHRAFQIFRFWL